MRFWKIVFICILLIFCKIFSQKYNLSNTFDTSNSHISGNFVFDMEKDAKGFLWIATQNGISRFDGKTFHNYTTKNGLPSNDIIQIVKDQYGKIWANCFRQPPSFFDEESNQFVTLKNKELEKKCVTYTIFSRDEKNNPLFIVGGKLFSVDKKNHISIREKINVDGNDILYSAKIGGKNISGDKTFLSLTNGKYLTFHYDVNDKKIIFFHNKGISVGKRSIEVFSEFKNKPFSYNTAQIRFAEPIKWHKISDIGLSVITADNHFRVYDLQTLKQKKDITIQENITSLLFDEDKGFFGGTMTEGLYFYSNSQISRIKIPENLIKQNFISIQSNEKGEVFAGNLNGEILKYNGTSYSKIDMGENAWIRKILFFRDKSLVVSDNFYSINFGEPKILKYKDQKVGLKKAKKINDSIALLSTLSGIFKLNIQTDQYEKLKFPDERVGDISQMNTHEFFVVSATGLYHYDLKANRSRKILEKYNFKESVYDGNLLFVTTFKNEIYLFKNDKLIRIISGGPSFPANAGRLKMIGNRLWIASTNGIYILSYSEKNGILNYQIQNISKNDGLTANTILDFSEFKDKVFIASEKGISVVPINIATKRYNIPAEIISIKINGKTSRIQNAYNLESFEKNVSIVFSGPELSGHFQNFIYRLNDEKWISISGNLLTINLQGGDNTLEITTADNNGNTGKSFKIMRFHVAVPFYKKIWFWAILGGLFFGGIIYAYSRWKFAKQQDEFRAKLALENQRNKITADLHDDIGATLSSLQINSAIANKMIEKEKISDAQKILKKIESQSQKLSENIGDIVWSLKPNKEALMTLSTRIRNSANEILGSSEIYYQINLDEEIDEAFHDFSKRKNIVLIVKEALNNIAKYSKATEVLIIFKKFEKDFILQIKDNGIGFTQDFNKGNGLQNMKRRTEEIGGIFEIFSENGTVIKIYIPEIRD